MQSEPLYLCYALFGLQLLTDRSISGTFYLLTNNSRPSIVISMHYHIRYSQIQLLLQLQHKLIRHFTFSLPHVIHTERQVAHEERGSFWCPPSLRGLPAVRHGFHGNSVPKGNENYPVLTGGDGSFSECVCICVSVHVCVYV